jgi:hypothetical protein
VGRGSSCYLKGLGDGNQERKIVMALSLVVHPIALCYPNYCCRCRVAIWFFLLRFKALLSNLLRFYRRV